MRKASEKQDKNREERRKNKKQKGTTG